MRTSVYFIAILLAALPILNGCKSSRSLGKELDEPFTEKKYHSDKKYLRASSDAISENSEFSEEKALLLAKEKLASSIQSVLKSVTSRYANDREIGNKSDFEQKVENETRDVVKLKMNNVVEMDKKKFQQKDKQFHCYVVIEILRDDVLKSVDDRLSKSSELKLDYDKQKFERIFNEEMDKLEGEQPK
jgi:hypothetical protein